jgi:ribosome-associated protein
LVWHLRDLGASAVSLRRITIDERAITEHFIRASGPGGQNVNKVATAVQLRFDLRSADLPDAIRARLARLAGKRVTREGTIVITSQRHRTQERNREAARAMLLRLIERATPPPARRIATRPSAASREERLADKAHRARSKQRRRTVPEEG